MNDTLGDQMFDLRTVLAHVRGCQMGLKLRIVVPLLNDDEAVLPKRNRSIIYTPMRPVFSMKFNRL